MGPANGDFLGTSFQAGREVARANAPRRHLASRAAARACVVPEHTPAVERRTSRPAPRRCRRASSSARATTSFFLAMCHHFQERARGVATSWDSYYTVNQAKMKTIVTVAHTWFAVARVVDRRHRRVRLCCRGSAGSAGACRARRRSRRASSARWTWRWRITASGRRAIESPRGGPWEPGRHALMQRCSRAMPMNLRALRRVVEPAAGVDDVVLLQPRRGDASGPGTCVNTSSFQRRRSAGWSITSCSRRGLGRARRQSPRARVSVRIAEDGQVRSRRAASSRRDRRVAEPAWRCSSAGLGSPTSVRAAMPSRSELPRRGVRGVAGRRDRGRALVCDSEGP